MAISAELLNNCLNGDRQSQFLLYKQYFSFLMGICYRYTNNKDDALHLVNEGFLKILTKMDRYNTEIPFELWIRRIMINTVIDHLRQSAREKKWIRTGYNGSEEAGDLAAIDFNTVEHDIEAQELDHMLQAVPDASRKVFNFYAVDGYSHKEIAQMLGISEGTSKWHLSNARQILQKQIKAWLKKNEVTVYETRKHA